MSWNGFDVAGCHGLSHGLQKNSTLADLDVSSNRVGIVAVTKLLEGMKRNTTLEILRVLEFIGQQYICLTCLLVSLTNFKI